eukprot:Blabericola_migrator_1__3517@NODE_2043_length_3376_cov_4_169840_g1297_i0_p3_GENE_NODE_2043_length_3376_cov_4_169840_g1297_i0NODE_2043_length_3376_cov_4_169840_g1297_i0_p3_ORF_typecomplete_len132_score20_20Peptidase_S8/PF00082_22/2e13_NODE_2043_length_3376_cov_4_169840_g1297_i022352630
MSLQDFGVNKRDPLEGSQDHGTETSATVAAQTNNGIGIASTCPGCSIVCLKVADTQGNLRGDSIMRALDAVAGSNITVSNHSYGGFGGSQAEFYAMLRTCCPLVLPPEAVRSPASQIGGLRPLTSSPLERT